MKNVFKLIGIIALAAVIGFSMAACKGGGDDDDPFEGDLAGTTWKCTETYYGMETTYTLIFTASRVTLEASMMGISTGTYNGTYTVNGSSVTVNWDPGYTGSGSFSINGNRLTSSEGNVFIKQ